MKALPVFLPASCLAPALFRKPEGLGSAPAQLLPSFSFLLPLAHSLIYSLKGHATHTSSLILAHTCDTHSHSTQAHNSPTICLDEYACHHQHSSAVSPSSDA